MKRESEARVVPMDVAHEEGRGRGLDDVLPPQVAIGREGARARARMDGCTHDLGPRGEAPRRDERGRRTVQGLAAPPSQRVAARCRGRPPRCPLGSEWGCLAHD